MMKVKIREYRKGDEHQITDLFRISIPHQRTVNYWRWANLEGPFSQSISLVLEDEKKRIIGHYAVMIFAFVYNDEIFEGGFGAQLVIHPHYRDFKLMWQLLNEIWKRSQEKGLCFIYAFPNNNIWPIKNKLMEWELIKAFPALELELKETNLHFENISELELLRIYDLAPHRDIIDNIWKESSIGYKDLIHIERNYGFVHWRFFQHPQEHYPFFLVKDNKTNVVGWIALKFYRKDNILYGHIVDLVVIHEELEEHLIMIVVKLFTVYGANVISLWGNRILRRKYEEIGFKEKGFLTNFGIRVFDDKLNERIELTNYNRWDLAMSYSDAF